MAQITVVHNLSRLPNRPNRHKLGYSTGTTYYTDAVVTGCVVNIRTDGASAVNKVVPLWDVSDAGHQPLYFCITSSTDAVAYWGGYVSLCQFNGARVTTDAVSTAPSVGSPAYLIDGTEATVPSKFHSSDASTSNAIAGIAVDTHPGYGSTYSTIECNWDNLA